MEPFDTQALAFKALSDSNRLRIVNMLSCQEMSTNSILEQIEISQPTLCHHMKILCDVGLVECRKENKMMYYKLSVARVKEFGDFISHILSCPESCPVKNAKCNCNIKRCR